MKRFHLRKDGNMWCATAPDFVDLQVSPAGFGPTKEAARDALIADFDSSPRERQARHFSADRRVSGRRRAMTVRISKWLMIAVSIVFGLLADGFASDSYNLQGFLVQGPISVLAAAFLLAVIGLVAAGNILKRLKTNAIMAHAFSPYFDRPTGLELNAPVRHKSGSIGVIVGPLDGDRVMVFLEDQGIIAACDRSSLTMIDGSHPIPEAPAPHPVAASRRRWLTPRSVKF